MRGKIRKSSEGVCHQADLDLLLLHSAQAFLEALQRQVSPSAESKENWAQFYLICDELMRRYANACHVRPSDMDDVLQSAWREITVSLPKFKDRGQIGRFYAWLHLIVHSKATDLCRYHSRHPSSSLSPHEESRLVSRDDDPANQRESKDRRMRLRKVFAELRKSVSPTNFHVFCMCCIKGRSASEVAAKLDLTTKQVRYRCFRVRQKFRLLFESHSNKD